MVDTKEKLNAEICECKIVHEDTVNYVRDNMKDLEDLTSLAEFFKVIGDLTRVRILSALETSEMCVCDIADLLNMSQSAISHQLRVLKKADLVKNRKQGKNMFYSLKDHHIENIFNQGFIHIKEKI